MVPVLRSAPLWLLVACSAGLTARSDDPTDFPTDAGFGESGLLPPGDDDDDVAPTGDNEAPVADAGDDLAAEVTDEVQLDGSSSFDPDGDPLTFSWALVTLPPDSTAFLINDTRDDASFYADRAGTYVAELVVDDGQASDVDEVEITVTAPNDGPIANAGPDQYVDVGDRVVLNGGSSYDPDGDPLSFSWSLVSVPTGSTATLTDPNKTIAQFTADLAGTYIAELVVDDGTSNSTPDQVRIIAQEASDSDCLSCAAANVEIQRRWRAGDVSSGLGLVLLPMLVMLWQRKREE